MAAPLGGPRCPQCRALVPAGSAWCMLCHADLRSDEERAAARAAAEAVAVATAASAATSAEPSSGRGRHRRSASPQLAATEAVAEAVPEAPPRVTSLDDVDVDAMLEQLAAEQPDRLGSVSGQLSDRTTKIVLVLGGAGVMTLLSLLGLAVLGSLFG